MSECEPTGSPAEAGYTSAPPAPPSAPPAPAAELPAQASALPAPATSLPAQASALSARPAGPSARTPLGWLTAAWSAVTRADGADGADGQIAAVDTTRVGELSISDRLWESSQSPVSLALVILSFGSARPVGVSGYPLAVLLLLIVSAAAALSRSIPDRRLPEPYRLYCTIVGLLTSSALVACVGDSFATSLVFLIAGHSGFRYPFRRAVSLGILASVATAVALIVALAVHHDAWDWYFGLFAGWPVLIGSSRRNRRDTLRNAQLALQQTVRASQAEAREVALAERSRIARDIHDVLAHSLSGVNMQLELAGALFDAGQDEKAQLALGAAKGMVRDGLTEARRAVTALREDALPLAQTLAGILDSGGEFSVDGQTRLIPIDVTQTLVRAAQESVTNIRRHAPGASVTMRLSYQETAVTLEVENGVPSTSERDRETTGSGGMGLIGMRERAQLLGGSVIAVPTQTGGWRVTVRLPVSVSASVSASASASASASERGATELGTAEGGATETGTTELGTTEPDQTQSDRIEPGTAEPGRNHSRRAR